MTELALIPESEVTIASDLKTAIDPFADPVTSTLAYRLESIKNVKKIAPKVITKNERIDRYYNDKNEDIPGETISPEYEKFVEQVEEVLRQFCNSNPYRMNVFLTVENEKGTKLFLSSLIRPTYLPLICTSTVELASKFVAELIEYQILFDFFSPPRIMTTPNFTVASQMGDCYDMSILLATILAGIGCNSYVIIGYANRELTLSDLSYRKCPGIAPEPEVRNLNEGPENTYLSSIKGRKLNLVSGYDRRKGKDDEAPQQPIVYPEPPIDEYDGKRLHCWVMVSKSENEKHVGPETIFIDASTGDSYPIDSKLFGYIEVAFNHENVWINTQPKDFEKAKETLDFTKKENWVSVTEEIKGVKIPSPVVNRLDIPEQTIFKKYPKSTSSDIGPEAEHMKHLYWADSVEELYAPFTREDGLVRRFSIFGPNFEQVKEIRENFQSLRQRLIERRIILENQEMFETFEPGLIVPLREEKDRAKQGSEHKFEQRFPIAIKLHHIKHEHWRYLEFDDLSRLDRLKSRKEEFGIKIVEKFGDRDDGLMQRKICIVPDSSSSKSSIELYKGGPKIRRITQKYRHPSLVQTYHTTTYALSNSIYKVAFDLVNNKMSVVYHHQPGCITDFSIEFESPPKDEKDRDKEYIANVSRVCPYPPIVDSWTMLRIQEELIKIKDNGLRDAECIANEMVLWVQFRTEEESKPYLHMKSVEIDLHRKLYEQSDESGIRVEEPPPKPKDEESSEEAKMKQQLSACDPLSVYFPDNQQEINAAVVIEIAKKATKALKKQLYDEAKHIESRIKSEELALRNKVSEFDMDQQQIRSDKHAKEHKNELQKRYFLINVLTKRRTRFRESAMRRFEDLYQMLNNHPKLAPFRRGNGGRYEDENDITKIVDEICKKLGLNEKK